jgi:small subunit ribosomal protein S8
MMTDPIADMLARIRNASIAHLDRAEIPLSKVKEQIAEILKQEGFISDFRVERDLPGKLTVFMRYGRDRESAIAGIRRKSRPGRRVYVGYREIPKVLNGLGVAIVSTSRGVMTDRDARNNKVGGELLCEVW